MPSKGTDAPAIDLAPATEDPPERATAARPAVQARPPADGTKVRFKTKETTRLAAIWRITRKDGQQFFFTDHDRDLAFEGTVFAARTGLEAAEATSELGFAVGGGEISGALVSAGLGGGTFFRLPFLIAASPIGVGLSDSTAPGSRPGRSINRPTERSRVDGSRPTSSHAASTRSIRARIRVGSGSQSLFQASA